MKYLKVGRAWCPVLLYVSCCVCAQTAEQSSSVPQPSSAAQPSIAPQPSTILLRVTPHPEQAFSALTYSGPAEITPSKPRLVPGVTILVLPDTLISAEKEQLKQQLIDAYADFHGRPVQFSFLTGKGEFAAPLPVASRAKLKLLLDKTLVGEDPSQTPDVTVLDYVLAVTSKLGPKSGTLLLAGALPATDSITASFASALLIKALAAQQMQVKLLSPTPPAKDWSPMLRALGGAAETEVSPASASAPSVSSAAESVVQLGWITTPPPAGFVVGHTIIKDDQGTQLADVADISSADNVTIPSIAQYEQAQRAVAEAETLLVEDPLTQERANKVREDIKNALQVNPRESGALSIATRLYEKAQDYPSAVSMASFLVEVKPRDGAAYAALGHALRLNSDLTRAETALKRAVDLGVSTPQVNEDFARLLIARKEDSAALAYLDQVLHSEEKRQDIWFLQAETASRLQNADLAELSYEQGLALGGIHIPEASALLRLYIAAKQTDKATQFAKAQLGALPPEPEPRSQLATTLDELQMSTLALEGWRRVIEVQPNSEIACTRIARLLLESGDAAGSEKEATLGLTTIPNSAPLFSVKADAEQKLGRIYDARRTLQEGLQTVADLKLAKQLATIEEQFSGGAGAVYARVAELEPSSPDRLHALEHGFQVSIRDGDLKQAEKFAMLLDAAGQKQYKELLGTQKTATNVTTIPGGLAALAFAAHGSKQEVPSNRFLLEFSRTLLVNELDTQKKYAEGLHEYFEQVAALRALGANGPDGTVINLSLGDKSARKQTEKALNILGIKLKSSKGEVEVTQGEKKSQAVRQETASALALDEIGIQEALQAGKPYRLVIQDEPASIYPSEQTWRDALGLKSYGPGGFAEELVRVQHMARLYVSLNSMDRAAANELLKVLPLKDLMEHESDLLYYYAPALALDGSHVSVPGGSKAETIWLNMVGANPATPAAFFRALLKRDDGKLLVYFSMLAELDRAHQNFFTANEGRTKHFYDLWVSTNQMHARPYQSYRDSGYQRMLRAVPLDDDGRVDFPGSPEVWTVAKGRSSDQEHTAHLLKKVKKAAAPDLEDAVLAHMADTKYKENSGRITELENFLAVSSVDFHRVQPMDEESALLLAQKYPEDGAVFPYLTDLRALTANDYLNFFSAFDHVGSHSALDANVQLGQIHGLVEWICLLVQRRVIKEEDAAELLRHVMNSFIAAPDGAAYTSASLEAVRAILHVCSSGTSASADQALQTCLLNHHASANDERLKNFLRVMDAQKVPSLNDLLAIYDAASAIGNAKATSTSLDAIQKALDNLPLVTLAKEAKTSGKERNEIGRYDPAPMRKLVAEMKEKASKRKSNTSDLQKLAHELMGELQPQVCAAIVGPIYAYFLRASDVVVMADPLLLRKHHYFDFSSDGAEHHRLPESDFQQSSEGIGSYFLGGFGQFPYAAGVAAAHSKNPGAALESLAAQLATLRSAEWDRLGESSQHTASLRIIVAREWIYESAQNPELLHSLSYETMGLLSLSRRADLLNGITFHEWRRAWDSITLSELLALGGRYPKLFPKDPVPSEATTALRAAEVGQNDWALNSLGPIPAHLFGCNHPHLIFDAPYEEYERHLPSEMGERSAEFKLFLAFQGDHLGLNPETLDDVAEQLAIKAVHSAQMSDYRDWRSLLNAYATVKLGDVEAAPK